MLANLLDTQALSVLTRDGRIFFATRFIRLFAYGALSVVLLLYLTQLGFSESKAGLLLTLTLLGDTVISLWITTAADRIGRKKMLIAGALLMLFAGVVFILTDNYVTLVIAATIGVISPSGSEVGPFLAIEQASLSHLIGAERRTGVFAWYNLTGSVATALGALAAGLVVNALRARGYSTVECYKTIVLAYAALGLVLAAIFLAVSSDVEVSAPQTAQPNLFLGLHRSRGIVLRLSALFALDAFAGGFVLQSLIAYWFHVRFGVDEAALGLIFCGANILAGFSALTASRIAAHVGLINTMVVTHIPSNVLLMLVPLMPNLPLAIAVLLARFSISQMDVPTRQAYTMAVVAPDERSAAAGVTGIARTTGAALSPVLAGKMLSAAAWFSAPFFIAGALKIIYDLLILKSFKDTHTEK